MTNSNYISYKDILSEIDIKKGDVVFVGSSILQLICVCRKNGEKFNPDVFIDSIINKIGDEGTLIFPTYNWDFCSGKTFDYEKSPSQTGALGSSALKRKDFKRTKHPIYSYAVYGKYQNDLCDLNNLSAFGVDSPMNFMYEKHCKFLAIGINYKLAFPLLHYAEEKVGVDYRYFKDFKAKYIDENGNESDRIYKMYVRNLKKCEISVMADEMDDILDQKKLLFESTYNGIYFGLVSLHETCNIMENDIKTKGGLVYAVVPEDTE